MPCVEWEIYCVLWDGFRFLCVINNNIKVVINNICRCALKDIKEATTTENRT